MRNNNLVMTPWDISLEERLRILMEAKEGGKKIALYYVQVPDTMTFRYRCYNTFQITQESKEWQAVFFFLKEKKIIEKILPKVNLVVLGRQFGTEREVRDLIRFAKENKTPIVLDIDDLIFDAKYMKTVLNTIGQLDYWDYWGKTFMENHKVASKMDGFLVTNDFLGEKISETFQKPYRVIRNSLDKEQIEASDVYLRLNLRKDDLFKIGYFSGSPTHINDLAEALPEIVCFLKKYKKAQLVVVGLMDFSEDVRPLLEEEKIVFHQPVDFRKLQRCMAEVDVNIAPLVINDFTNCKSELKFFEAAVVRTVTVASPTYTFRKAITEGKNGFLAQPGEWYDKLEYLYKNREKAAKIAEDARRYVLKEYAGEVFLKEVEDAYNYYGR